MSRQSDASSPTNHNQSEYIVPVEGYRHGKNSSHTIHHLACRLTYGRDGKYGMRL